MNGMLIVGEFYIIKIFLYYISRMFSYRKFYKFNPLCKFQNWNVILQVAEKTSNMFIFYT